jgi:catechol 2,3-dioxygenase-like lactoylglutathione lyase family enzyme
MGHVLGFDHMQVAIPRGQEDRVRTFYAGLLGLMEIPKPGASAGRGGVWFQCGQLQLHLGVEEPFAPAGKAHPALRIQGYEQLLAKLIAAGYRVVQDTQLPGVTRSFVSDPFGNRIELIDGENSAN